MFLTLQCKLNIILTLGNNRIVRPSHINPFGKKSFVAQMIKLISVVSLIVYVASRHLHDSGMHYLARRWSQGEHEVSAASRVT